MQTQQPQDQAIHLRTRIECFQMDLKQPFYRLFSALEGDIKGEVGTAHIATVGHWKGYRASDESEGKEFELTHEIFDQMIANFQRYQTPPPVYYDHEPGRAAGKVIKLWRDGDDLFAHFAYTEKAAQMVRDGEYFGVSIGFRPWFDPETSEDVGMKLIEVSLTNEPFIDGLTPLQLSNRKRGFLSMPGTQTQDKSTKLSAREVLRKVMNRVTDDTTADQAHEIFWAVMRAAEGTGDIPLNEGDAAMDENEETQDSNGEAPSDSEDKQLQNGDQEQNVAASDAMALLAEETGLEPAAIVAGVREHLSEISELLKRASEEDGTPSEESTEAAQNNNKSKQLSARVHPEVIRLSNKLEKLELERAREKAEARVDSLINGTAKEGVLLTEGQRPHWVKLCLSSRDLFEDQVKDLEKNRGPLLRLGRQGQEVRTAVEPVSNPEKLLSGNGDIDTTKLSTRQLTSFRNMKDLKVFSGKDGRTRLAQRLHKMAEA